MTKVPTAAVPTIVKELSHLNGEGVFLLDRDALAMLAAVDGRSSIDELARLHGTSRTYDGITRLLDLGAIRFVGPRLAGGPEASAQRASAGVPAPGAAKLRVGWRPPALARASSPRVPARYWSAAIGIPVVGAAAALFVWMSVHDVRSPLVASDGRGAIVAPKLGSAVVGHADSRPGLGDCDAAGACGTRSAEEAVEGAAPEAAAPDVLPTAPTEASALAAPMVTPEPALRHEPGAAMPPTEPAAAVADPGVPPPAAAVAPHTTTAASAAPATAQTTRRVTLDERFADNGRGWPDGGPQSTAWLAEGGYRMFARAPGRFVAIGVPTAQAHRDVTITGRFRKVGGPSGGGYGLILRDQGGDARDGVGQGGRYFVFEVGDRGEIGIWRREGDHWVDLLTWTPSHAVQQGSAPNELVVRTAGDQLVFLVNGVEVASRSDAELTAGRLGVFVGGDGNQVVLERLLIETPD